IRWNIAPSLRCGLFCRDVLQSLARSAFFHNYKRRPAVRERAFAVVIRLALASASTRRLPSLREACDLEHVYLGMCANDALKLVLILLDDTFDDALVLKTWNFSFVGICKVSPEIRAQHETNSLCLLHEQGAVAQRRKVVVKVVVIRGPSREIVPRLVHE